MRKAVGILMSFIVPALFTQCTDEDGVLTEFEVNREYTFEIPAINNPLAIPGIFEPTMSFHGDQEFKNNDTRVDRIKDIELQKLKFTIKSPDDRTFKFLKSVKIYINADGKDKELIAVRKSIPDNIGDHLELETKTKNLAPYVKKQEFEMSYDVEADETTDSETKVKANVEFDVTAEVID